MQILYTLTQAEWDDVKAVTWALGQVKDVLNKSHISNHEKHLHEIVAELIEQNKELTSKLKEQNQ